MKSIRMILLLCIVLLAGTLASGCVYYNTFYNARKQYQEAERKREESENVAATGQKSRQMVFRYRDFYMAGHTQGVHRPRPASRTANGWTTACC